MGWGLDIVVRGDGELRVAGRLGRRTATQLRDALESALREGSGDLVVAAADLEIWDAVGLGVLSGAARKARRAVRRFVVTDARAREQRLLRAARVPTTSRRTGRLAS